MKLLLDTHALIWVFEGNRQLSKTARLAVADPANTILVSVVSVWEIAIKTGLERLRVPDDVIERIDQAGFSRLPLGFAEIKHLNRLPHHHGDPFDRMLIAQALEHGASLVTRDESIVKYRVPIVW
jgi:PIN domain nuclease of toxin-antitoxin system